MGLVGGLGLRGIELSPGGSLLHLLLHLGRRHPKDKILRDQCLKSQRSGIISQ